jgi:hypothetical protein
MEALKKAQRQNRRVEIDAGEPGRSHREAERLKHGEFTSL